MNTYEDLLKALGDLFDELEPETPTEVDEVIREAGYEPDQVGTFFQKVAKHAFEVAVERQSDKARLDMAQALTKLEGSHKVIPEDRADKMALLKDLLLQIKTMGVGLPVGVKFRNYEEMSDIDLGSLIEELQYLIGKQGMVGKGGV